MMRHRKLHVREDIGEVVVEVLRLGDCQDTVRVKFRTENVSSGAQDFKPREGELEFLSGEMVQYIHVAVHDDRQFELVERFRVLLVAASPSSSAQLGVLCTTEVLVLDNDPYPNQAWTRPRLSATGSCSADSGLSAGAIGTQNRSRRSPAVATARSIKSSRRCC